MPPTVRPDIPSLIAALAADDAVTRESAAARLAVAGERAIPAVQALVSDDTAASTARILGLFVVWDVHRHQGIATAADAAAAKDDPLALEAVELLGQALDDSSDVTGGDLALEHLTRLVLDNRLPPARRRAMLGALRRLPRRLREPVFHALSSDAALAGEARTDLTAPPPPGRLERWADEERLPAAPTELSAAIATEGQQAAITTLARLVALTRRYEKDGHGADREAWHHARGLLHETLARRGSLLALYDLRETLEDRQQRVSAPMLAAATQIGDESCLDGVAARWVHAGEDIWLRDQLERIFHAILTRERLHRRSPALSRLLKRHPAAGPLVAMAPRQSRPAR